MASPCYCTKLRLATRRIQSLYDTALAPFGITVAQFALLRLIRRKGPVSLTDLAAAAELERSTMGRNSQVLQRLGLILSERGKDQREAAIRLSPEGETVLAQAMPVWDACQADIEARVGAETLAGIDRLLKTLPGDTAIA